MPEATAPTNPLPLAFAFPQDIPGAELDARNCLACNEVLSRYVQKKLIFCSFVTDQIHVFSLCAIVEHALRQVRLSVLRSIRKVGSTRCCLGEAETH